MPIRVIENRISENLGLVVRLRIDIHILEPKASYQPFLRCIISSLEIPDAILRGEVRRRLSSVQALRGIFHICRFPSCWEIQIVVARRRFEEKSGVDGGATSDGASTVPIYQCPAGEVSTVGEDRFVEARDVDSSEVCSGEPGLNNLLVLKRGQDGQVAAYGSSVVQVTACYAI